MSKYVESFGFDSSNKLHDKEIPSGKLTVKSKEFKQIMVSLSFSQDDFPPFLSIPFLLPK